MPSSTWAHISNVMDTIYKASPESILDVGIGYGKWGFLCREYLESWKDRVFPEQWQVRLEGIEIFAPYYERLPWVRQFYNTVHIGDACSVVDDLCTTFDLVLAGDVLEHINKEAATELLPKLMKLTQKLLIVCLPIGERWLKNRIVADNQAEQHRATWEIGEVIRAVGPGNEFRVTTLEYEVAGRPYAVFMFFRGS